MKRHWAITIKEWGTLFAIGTETQAETWRAYKSDWEGCPGSKRLATEKQIKENKFEKLEDLL